MTIERITLGGGCFWCLDAAFRRVKGIESVISGYANGLTDNPDYKEICRGDSGHAEVVQIQFDTNHISFRGILEIFFAIHDPTTLNKQGNDIGTQYRSIIAYENELQQIEARNIINTLDTDENWSNPIATEVEPLSVFYPAEEYHQNYYNQNQTNGYCQVVISPKINKLESLLKKNYSR